MDDAGQSEMLGVRNGIGCLNETRDVYISMAFVTKMEKLHGKYMSRVH